MSRGVAGGMPDFRGAIRPRPAFLRFVAGTAAPGGGTAHALLFHGARRHCRALLFFGLIVEIKNKAIRFYAPDVAGHFVPVLQKRPQPLLAEYVLALPFGLRSRQVLRETGASESVA